MSSDNTNKVDPGCATIIAAVIGAVALIAGTLIGAVIGAKSQPIQVFLGSDTPTTVAQPNILGIPLPQPTYTLLPTYTPYPTLAPPQTIVAPKPITVIPTLSPSQQNPLAGSTIAAGQGFSKNGVTVTMRNPISIGSSSFQITLVMENQSGREVVVLWKNSFVHARNDRGTTYFQQNQNSKDWDRNKQFTVPNGKTREFEGLCGHCMQEDTDVTIPPFLATLDPRTKYIVITVDQLVGMTNLNWRYDIQQ
jgi:hypothetical protein